MGRGGVKERSKNEACDEQRRYKTRIEWDKRMKKRVHSGRENKRERK